MLDQPESLNGEGRRENALGNPAFFGLVQSSTPHRHEDPDLLESGGVWHLSSLRHMWHDGFFKIFRVELKSPVILIIIDFTISHIPNMSFFLCCTKSGFLLQVHLGPEEWGDSESPEIKFGNS